MRRGRGGELLIDVPVIARAAQPSVAPSCGRASARDPLGMFPLLTREGPPQVVDLRGGGIEDVFDAWVFAAGDATRALEAWTEHPHDGGTRYAVYRAALEREEKAAAVLAAVILELR
jgi:hypothetical protein